MDKIQNVAEQGLGLVDRSRRLRAVILVSALAWATVVVLLVAQTSTTESENTEPSEPAMVITDNYCRTVTDAAVDAIGAFTDFLDAMNDNNAMLATIAQRAAARGLVNQSDTDRLRNTNDTLELLNRELVYVLGTFEREAARCYAQR